MPSDGVTGSLLWPDSLERESGHNELQSRGVADIDLKQFLDFSDSLSPKAFGDR